MCEKKLKVGERTEHCVRQTKRECEREKGKVNAREKEELREIVSTKSKGGREREEKRGKRRERDRHNIPEPPVPGAPFQSMQRAPRSPVRLILLRSRPLFSPTSPTQYQKRDTCVPVFYRGSIEGAILAHHV